MFLSNDLALTDIVKILYVEDDPGSQNLISRILQAEGYEVVLASSGLEGINKAKAEHPNLILMDINIGDLDGYEVTTKLRSIGDLQDTPIVALTANTLKGDKERALVAGCDGYISKPIDVDAFPKQILNFLDGYREIASDDQRLAYLPEHYEKVVTHLQDKVVDLQKANEALQSLEQMKADFITVSAHELRTPITLVFGYARLLMNAEIFQNAEDFDHTYIKHLADKIFASISRLNDVVNDILNVSLIQANKMDLDFHETSIDAAIQAALSELNPAEKGRKLTVNLRSLSSLPIIKADENRLRLVFWNLLSNAIKYTPDGGTVTVTGHADENYIYVQVKDDGIGIPPEKLDKIFENFYIAGDTSYHSSSKVNFMGGGLGIGLSIAAGILKAHEGAIWAESMGISGEGSTLYVKIPLS